MYKLYNCTYSGNIKQFYGRKNKCTPTIDSFSRVEFLSWNACNELDSLKTIVERFKERISCYPEQVLADKIYRNTNNLNYCKINGIRLSGLI